MSGDQHDTTTRAPAATRQPAPFAVAQGEGAVMEPSPGLVLRRAVAAPRALTAGDVLRLQRSVGNRAVGALLRAGRAPAGVVQARPAYFKPTAASGVGSTLTALDNLARSLDAVTEAAHLHVVGKMQRAADDSDAYELTDTDFPHSSNRRFAFWVETLQGSNASLKAAATGYMIEDIVTAWANGRTGYESQVSSGGARPDFVVSDGTRRGVVDVTSTGDIGHVLDKDFDINSFAYAIESLYPSVDFSNISRTALAVSDSAVGAVAAARAARANAKLANGLGNLRNTLNLIKNAGTMLYNQTTLTATDTALARIATMSSSGITTTLTTQLDAALTTINANQTVVRLDKIADVITWLQGKYGVSGNPLWS
ncbi:MAG: hypothetical protein JWM27_169 [Gemmatimonadetes bacterium]|nr:hypothetical protein [Gemmatimonadota bacterium]